MANVVSIIIGPDEGLHIVASDGGEFHATPAEVREFVQSPALAVPRTQAQRSARMAGRLSLLLGRELLSSSAIAFDSSEDGTPLNVEVS
jgi:hypothetical protein